MSTNRQLFVPFRMHSTGWILLCICMSIGIWIAGPSHGVQLGVMLLVSLLLHEIGHMFVATRLRVPVKEFGLRMGGAYNRRAYATRRRDEVLISAAGPMMNLLLVVPFLFVPQIGPQLALGNLALGLVNLLPFPSSDGLHILRTLRGVGLPVWLAAQGD